MNVIFILYRPKCKHYRNLWLIWIMSWKYLTILSIWGQCQLEIWQHNFWKGVTSHYSSIPLPLMSNFGYHPSRRVAYLLRSPYVLLSFTETFCTFFLICSDIVAILSALDISCHLLKGNCYQRWEVTGDFVILGRVNQAWSSLAKGTLWNHHQNLTL